MTDQNGGIGSWLLVPQPKLRPFGFVALLAVINILTPFSLDMYTPAVPNMPEYFNTTEQLINLTILGFFLFFAVGLLIFGPISDKQGRKPVLVGGMAAYTLGCVVCALSPNVYVLIAARIVAALGAGAASAVSTALIKDCFEPKSRETMLSILQVLMVVGPVAAPLIGGVILQFGEWPLIFWTLSAVGLLCTLGSLLFSESLPKEQRTGEGVLRSLTRLGHYVKMPSFFLLCLVAGIFSLPFMAYVAVGSYIYIDIFGCTEQVYTYFFAGTALATVIGPILYLRFSDKLNLRIFTWTLILVTIGVSIALMVIGGSNVWAYCITFGIFAVFEAVVRPYATNILLMQAERDVGSASSLINFSATGLGALGMVLIMAPWPNYVVGVGGCMLLSMIFALVLWVVLLKLPCKVPGIKE